jgi:hypothetical protein
MAKGAWLPPRIANMSCNNRDIMELAVLAVEDYRNTQICRTRIEGAPMNAVRSVCSQIPIPEDISSLIEWKSRAEFSKPAFIVGIVRRASITGILLMMTATSNFLTSNALASDTPVSQSLTAYSDDDGQSAEGALAEKIDGVTVKLVVESIASNTPKHSAIENRKAASLDPQNWASRACCRPPISRCICRMSFYEW